MSEPIASTTSTESAPETGGDSRLDAAQESFERAAERAGVGESAPAAEREPAGVQTPGTGTPPARTERDGDRAHAEFGFRRQRAREARIFDALSRLAEREAGQGGGETGAPAAAPVTPPAPTENPHDRETDYWNWLDWENKALREGIVSAFDEKLKPVLSFFEEQQAARAEQQEYDRQQARRRQWFQEQAGYAREAHEVYSGTEEGKGYMDRVFWHVGDPGHPGDPARGIPARAPQDGALTLGFIAAGFPEQTARQLALAHMHAMQDLALKHNLNPAVAIDRFTRAQIAAAAPFFLGAAGGTDGAVPGGGNGNGAPASRPASPARRRIQGMKETAASAVASSVAEASPRGGGDLESTLRRMAAADKLGPAEMRELAKRFYGSDSPQNLGKLSKAMNALAAELRAG